MPFTLDELPQLLESHALRLGAALSVLLVGWLVALVISGVLRKGIQRTRLGKSFGKKLMGEGAKGVSVDLWISRGVFYILLLFVFVAFFEVLGLDVINEPLNRFLVKVFEFAPRLIAPIVLILIAWIVATILKFLVVKLLGHSRLNELLSKWVGIEGNFQESVALTLGNTIYWLIFLIFSLAILDALNLQGLLEPLQQMFQQILGFLPNVFAALLILGFGWFFARIVQRIVSNLLEAVGVDRLSDQIGIKSALGSKSLSALLGLIAYVIILIPVLIASLNALQLDSITQPASDMLNKILNTLPDIFAAFLVLCVAWVVGRFGYRLVGTILTNAGFNAVLAKLGFGIDPTDYNTLLSKMGIGEAPAEGTKTPSEIVGYLFFLGVLAFATIEALELVGFEQLAVLLTQFVLFCSRVLLGLIIFALGLFISNVVANTIQASGNTQANMLAIVSRISILVLAGAMGLQQMGLAERIINLAFGIILGSVALSMAIAFGIGGRDVAGKLLKELVDSIRPTKKSR